MYKIAKVLRYNILKIVVSLMYFGLDEKIYAFYAPFISFCNIFNHSIAKKISSTKFEVFGPAEPEHLFHENFYI